MNQNHTHTHNSKARHATATPGIAMLAMADNHIQTNSVGLQRVVRGCYEQNARAQTPLPLHKRFTNAQPPHSGPQNPSTSPAFQWVVFGGGGGDFVPQFPSVPCLAPAWAPSPTRRVIRKVSTVIGPASKPNPHPVPQGPPVVSQCHRSTSAAGVLVRAPAPPVHRPSSVSLCLPTAPPLQPPIP